MNRGVGAFCIALLLSLSTLTFQNLTIARSVTGEETEYYVKSTVTYSNCGNNVWNFTEREEDRTIGLFMNNSWQTVYLENSTIFIEARKNDTDGNQVALLQFSEMVLNSGDNISYSVTYRVVSKPRTLGTISERASGNLSRIPEPLKEKYLGAEGPWLVNDTALQSLAYNITGTESNVLTIVRNFVTWITENISYETHETPLYPNETFSWREGDCDDQAILLVAMSRIVGIPAFLQIGAIYTSYPPQTNESYWGDHVTVVQKRIGWHGWAMVYIPPWGWLPVDLTYVFGGIGDNPLNAITNAAVTSQGTIQFMSISQIDYVASSREARDFLVNNNFYVYLEDELIETIGRENPFWESVRNLFPVVIVATGALLLTGSYFIARRLNRKEDMPTA